MGSSEKSKTGSLFRESEELSGRRVLGRGGNRKQGKRLLKSLRDENGQKMFTKTDWLTEQQIARYFSRLSALNKAGRLQRTHSSLMNEDEEADADDLVVEAEAVRTRQQIRRDLEL